VYARLSLHYFSDLTTKRIFSEIARVLKPNGYLCFLCKSTNDPLYGKGNEIEKDMYENKGHVRHFFSKEYATELMQQSFEIQTIEEGEETFYGSQSAFIKVIATVRK
jgi:ubiquinone/menaquinone biosynthesis C-methylase UbiE